MWKADGPDTSEMTTPKRVRISHRKTAIQFAFSSMEDKYGEKKFVSTILSIGSLLLQPR